MSSIGRGDQPRTLFALLRAQIGSLPQGPDDRADAAIEQRHATDQEIGEGPGRDLRGPLAQAVAEDLARLGHPEEFGDRDEALAAGLRRGHRPDLKVGDIAHVDEVEAEPGHARHAVEQPLDRLERVGEVVVQNRADDGARVDDGEPVLRAALA